ncbi:BTB/POZ protein [Rhizophagus irregularis DAOM 181602=DAOM 197198]|nr:BTB/POZ protein [Rhizophagus irregularis DAOM 181602=DAOM 197198]
MDDYKFMLKLSKNLLEVLNDDEYHDVTIEVVKLPNISPEIFQIILRYIYGVYQTSFENNSFLELQKYCTNLISDEPDKIFNSPKFFSIPEKLLISLIQNDYLEMNEVQIWEKVIKWGISQHPEFPSNFTDYSKDELKTLKNTLQHCISFIRFYNLSSGEFMDKVLPYRKLLPKELYEDLLKTFLNLLDPNSKSSNKSNPRKIKHNKSNQTSSQHDDEPRINKVQGSLSNDGEKTFKWKSSEPSLKTDKPTGFVLPSSFKSEKSDQSNVPGFSSNDTNKPIGFGFGSFKSEKSEHSNVPGFSSIKSDETSRFSPNDTNKPIGFGFGSFKSEKSEHSNVPGFSSIKSDEPNRFSSNDTNKFTVSGSSSLFKSEKSEHSNVPGLSSDELKRFSFMYGLPSSFLKSEKSEQSNVSGFSSIKSDELKRFSSNDTDELLGYGLPSSFLKSEKSEQSNVSGFSSIKSDEPKQLSLNDTDEFPGFGLSSFKSEKSERRN